MGSQQEIAVRVLAQAGALFEGKCAALFVPSAQGEVAIMPFHVPLIMLLVPGKIRVRQGKQFIEVGSVTSGVLHVGINEATVLVGG